jgi:uncharacterized repeat protein (TIGR03803 family)
MRSREFSIGPTSVVAVAYLSMLSMSTPAVAGEKVLHNFNGKNGRYPTSSLIFDAEGNLYAATVAGGANDKGMVFELSPKIGGGWAEKALHSFTTGGTDGLNPNALTFDAAGNLWGTTYSGGAYGRGIVFELSPDASGNWVERVRHSFGHGTDGSSPGGKPHLRSSR